ncbi:MAG: glutamine--fructose-6-phosphate transaminase (isomerizing), partial [Alphaproteobacteria bacterium]|nr:glutamine--fructose-6-phosphate transaminase (isomerizing) [Alphaproteobacteria bacterium]
MCGIIGIVGRDGVADHLLEGLRRLEYRGYDSAGIATVENGRIDRRRAKGKLVNLRDRLKEKPLSGRIGIGHTRWATHGAPNEDNAHPHATDKVAVVHNGIIENFRALREELVGAGYTMSSETDSEVIAHLITAELDRGATPQDAAAKAFARLEGAFGLAVVFAGNDDLLIGARRGSPLVVGYGDGEMFLGSDALAVGPLSRQLVYLEEGDWVELTSSSLVIHDETGAVMERPIKTASQSGGAIDKGNYRHFMLKEIHEQPSVIGDTLASYIDPLTRKAGVGELPFDLAKIDRVTLIACGTSSYAAQVAKYWMERIARIGVEVDIASEFRYREAAMPEGGLAVFISQSGETADTLAALRYAREQNQHIAAIVNVPESSIARESDVVLPTQAGPEIGVASTKAFTCQLVVLAALTLSLARARGTLSAEKEAILAEQLIEVPAECSKFLNDEAAMSALERTAVDISSARDVLYMGRGTLFPLAMEGALKLKEISYIHAEGYAAGELKHGPIALIDEAVPIVVLAPSTNLFEKSISNMQEVIARDGRVVL